MQTKHSLPENFCWAVPSFHGAIANGAITADQSVAQGITRPGQGALERAAQVVKCPRYDHIIVEAHQRGHTQHPDSNACIKRHGGVRII